MKRIVHRRSTLLALSALAAASMLPAAQAQSYPAKPIRMIVPFPPGGLTDLVARAISERLRQSLGQAVVVENRPGAGGLVGAAQLAASPPDGYALMLASMAVMCISPVLFRSAKFKASDATGVSMIGTASLVLVARQEFPAKDLAQLVSVVRSQGTGVNYASPANGTAHHLLVEMLKLREKLSATHVPYQGTTQALTDLVSGRVDFMFLDVAAAVPQITAGKIKPIAITGSKRSTLLPEVPAIAETYADLDLQPWLSVVAPAGTPSEISARLNAEINKLLATAEFQATLRKGGLEPNPMSIAAFNDVIAKEVPRWGRLVKASGVSVD